jgi:hypothetical protein
MIGSEYERNTPLFLPELQFLVCLHNTAEDIHCKVSRENNIYRAYGADICQFFLRLKRFRKIVLLLLLELLLVIETSKGRDLEYE